MSDPQSISLLLWPTRLVQSKVRVLLSVPGDPVSKQRPRMTVNTKSGRSQVYTPGATVVAEENIRWHILQAHRALIPDADSSFGVRLLFCTKSYQRRDLDNMTKLIFDACNGVVWKDDVQVHELMARLIRADENPRTEIAIYSLGLMARPTVTCGTCGKQFRTYPSWPNRGYCSAKCAGIAHRSGQEYICAQCGKSFYRAEWAARRPAVNVFCSVECKNAHGVVELTCSGCGSTFLRQRSLANRGPNVYCSEKCLADVARVRRAKAARGVCQRCGGSTSKKTYQHCRSCAIELGFGHYGGARPAAEVQKGVTETRILVESRRAAQAGRA